MQAMLDIYCPNIYSSVTERDSTSTANKCEPYNIISIITFMNHFYHFVLLV